MADEVERMITVTRRSDGRLAKREDLLIMTAYPLASELIAQRWGEIDLKASTPHVSRPKHGSASTLPLSATTSLGEYVLSISLRPFPLGKRTNIRVCVIK